MASFVERLWAPEEHGQLSRRDRAPGRYLAYVPDELGTKLPSGRRMRRERLRRMLLAVLARADERIAGARGVPRTTCLIRSESISSSWIEGNRVTPKRHGALQKCWRTGRGLRCDVIGNVRATEDAIAALADRGRPITTADIEELQHVIEPSLPRGLRTEQNWVGGSGWSPLRAEFVPATRVRSSRASSPTSPRSSRKPRGRPRRARRDRARAVRDDPPVHRRQWPHRTCPHSHGAASRRRVCATC